MLHTDKKACFHPGSEKPSAYGLRAVVTSQNEGKWIRWLSNLKMSLQNWKKWCTAKSRKDSADYSEVSVFYSPCTRHSQLGACMKENTLNYTAPLSYRIYWDFFCWFSTDNLIALLVTVEQRNVLLNTCFFENVRIWWTNFPISNLVTLGQLTNALYKRCTNWTSFIYIFELRGVCTYLNLFEMFNSAGFSPLDLHTLSQT